MTPQHYLEQGAKFPYDATDEQDDSGDLPPAKDWAHAAVRGIVLYLNDQFDDGGNLHSLIEDARIEIVETLAAIIRAAAAKVFYMPEELEAARAWANIVASELRVE